MFSKLSIIFAVISAVLLSFSYIYSTYFEIFMISGLGLLFISLLLSLGAAFKRTRKTQVFARPNIFLL